MMRISNQWVVNSFMRVLNRNHAELAKTQVQVSSGKQIQTPSENPVNNALAMQHKTEILENDQYVKNISRTGEWLDNTDGVMTTLESLMQRVRELAVQGANDTLSQNDRDAIGKEVDQLLQEVVNIGNTDVGGEYIFAGAGVKTKPFQAVSGQTPYSMKDIVTYSQGLTRSNLNALNGVDVKYLGNSGKLATEIEKGVTINKNITGSELFFRGNQIPQPTFDKRSVPLSSFMNLTALNDGKGVQKGNIVLTDSNGVDYWIDLKSANRLDDVVYAINSTGAFEATIDSIPTTTASGLGIMKSSGAGNKITGNPMIYLNNPTTDFDPTVATLDQLGVPTGFLVFNTKDGQSRRVDVQAGDTLQNMIDDINNLNGGSVVKAEFDPIQNRLYMTDLTSGLATFSIESKKNELKIRDLPAHTASDLGLLTTDSLSDGLMNNTITSTYQINSEATVLTQLNGTQNLNTQFSGYMSLFQNRLGNNTLSSPVHAEIANGSVTLTSLGITGGTIMITGRDGASTPVYLSSAQTIDQAATAIGVQTGGKQTAAWDNLGKTFTITDNTASIGASFQVQPALPPEAISLSALNSGKGIEKGYINIINGDGINSTTVDLTGAQTLEDVLAAINNSTSGGPPANRVTASFDTVTQKITLNDLFPGANATEFRVEEVNGANNIKVREATNVANRLGLLKSEAGKTILGDSLNLLVDLGTLTPLANILPLPPDLDKLVLKGADGTPVEVSLNSAVTIQNVLDGINNTGKFSATWNTILDRFEITDVSGVSGDQGISIEEKTNTARDLGFIQGTSLYRFDGGSVAPMDTIASSAISVGNMPTLIGSLDLNPAVEGTTQLSSLNSGRVFERGIKLGRIRIHDKAYDPSQTGHSAVIDLRDAKTVQDVLDKINDPANGLFMEARINRNKDGIELVDKNHGAKGWIEVVDIDSSTAADLGFTAGKNRTIDNVLSGGDIDPAVTEDTKVTSLRVNEGGVPLGKVFVQSGDFSGEIDLTGARTVGDIINRFSLTDTKFNLSAWLDPDGKRLNLSNTKGQAFIKVRDLGTADAGTASSLGLGGSQSIFETLQDLRDNLFRNDSKAISEQSIKIVSDDLDRVLKLHAEVGVKTNRIEAAQEKQENIKLHINKLLDVVENVDMTEAITRMTQLDTAFQAALQTGAKLLTTTLMDFLK